MGCSFLTTTPASTFAPEDFSADEQLMVATAEQFSRKEVLPIAERLEKQEEGLMPALVRKAGALGFCGPDAPEAYGGLGLSRALAARLLEYLSLNPSLSVTIGVTSGIGQVGLTLFGSEEQKRQYLPRLTSGEWIGAYALSEPNSGSDALSASAKAERRGDRWVLNGTKMWISNAKWADLFLVMAKTGGGGLSGFLVERGYPGVSVSREEYKLGLKGSSTARLVLDDAEVPLENLLYEEGLGHQVAFNALNLGRFKLSAMCQGPAREAMGLAAAYSLDRKQFGQPVASFGLIRKKFAQMAFLFYGAESMMYRTGGLIDSAFRREAGCGIDGNKRAAEEFSVEASACKVFASEVQAFIVDEALQCYGGYGYTEEFPIARLYRDARISRIYEGTNEISRVFMSSRWARRTREGRAELRTAGDSFLSELLGKAVAQPFDDQIRAGAISDLMMLGFVEQSSRLRAARCGGLQPALYSALLNWVNVRAAEAYQVVTGQAVSLPAPAPFDWDQIALAVLERKGPAV